MAAALARHPSRSLPPPRWVPPCHPGPSTSPRLPLLLLVQSLVRYRRTAPSGPRALCLLHCARRAPSAALLGPHAYRAPGRPPPRKSVARGRPPRAGALQSRTCRRRLDGADARRSRATRPQGLTRLAASGAPGAGAAATSAAAAACRQLAVSWRARAPSRAGGTMPRPDGRWGADGRQRGAAATPRCVAAVTPMSRRRGMR
jgi:hypothetical protein